MTCASSGRVWPVRRCSLKDRTCALALCKASLLIAGRNDVKLRPFVPPKGPSILHLCTAPHQEDLPRRLLSAFVAHQHPWSAAPVIRLPGHRQGPPRWISAAERERRRPNGRLLSPGPRQSRGLHHMSDHACRLNLAPGLDQRSRVVPDHDVGSSDKRDESRLCRDPADRGHLSVIPRHNELLIYPGSTTDGGHDLGDVGEV